MSRSRIWMGFVLGLALTAFACSQTDPGITTAVKSKLAADDTVKAYQIDVDTSNHVVTLKGSVDNEAAKDRALQIARDTKGVTSVTDQLTVTPGTAPTTGATPGEAPANAAADRAGDMLSDASITAAVKSKFLADTNVSGLKIDVDTDHGVVTLTGTLPSRDEASLAIRLTRETGGVKDVVDHLKIERKK